MLTCLQGLNRLGNVQVLRRSQDHDIDLIQQVIVVGEPLLDLILIANLIQCGLIQIADGNDLCFCHSRKGAKIGSTSTGADNPDPKFFTHLRFSYSILVTLTGWPVLADSTPATSAATVFAPSMTSICGFVPLRTQLRK